MIDDIPFSDLCRVAEFTLPSHIDIASKITIETLLDQQMNATKQSLQEITLLLKALIHYKYLTILEQTLYQQVEEFIDEFTTSQLETLLWSLISRPNAPINAIKKRVLGKVASMKPRGVAYAVEAFSNLD